MFSVIDIQELWEEVCAAVKELNVLFAAEIKGVASVRFGHLNTHHIILCGQVRAWLTIRGDLPTRLTVAASRVVPDGEELRVWHIWFTHRTHVVDQENEARHGDTDVAA